MEKIDLREIEKIEKDSVIKNTDWYYHGFDFAYTSDILKEGILAKRHLGYACPNFGLNGKYYISVAKDITGDDLALSSYKQYGPLAILDNLKVIKCKKSQLNRLFIYTPIPLRYSAWSDEYQVYDKIAPEKIIGFECMVHEWVKKDNIFLLRRLHTMIEIMQLLDCNLPMYDFSRQEGDNVHELDKEEYLKLSESIVDNSIESTLGLK